jgi:hypothetical protein
MLPDRAHYDILMLQAFAPTATQFLEIPKSGAN